IESQLKKFVRLHHLDLSRKINFQINTFQDHIREKELFQLLLLYPLTNEQQQTLQRLSFLRQQQFATFEEMTKLEVRILCRILPKSINELDRLIPANHLSSTNTNLPNNNSVYELIKNQQKMIREYKRQLLAKNFEEYESTIEEIEFQFQKELFQLESELSYNIDDNEQINTNTNHLVNVINNYLHCQTTRQMRALRYNETIFRYKLLHPSHPRSSKSNYKNTISIYPEAIIELFEQIFTKKELDLLSTLGPSYIRLNQSSVQKQKVVQKKVKHQHTTMIHKLATDLNRRHGLPTKSAIIKQFGSQSEVIFNQQFSTSSSLTYHNMYRTRHELNTILSIKRKLKRLPIIIRQSDKTGIMHIGYKSDYDKKVLLYQEKTIAYKELIYNPLIDTFFKVIRVLNDLLRDKEIKVWQYKKMVPDQNKIQLAYLYFIPKPHKEGTPLRPIVSSINAPTTGISKLLDRLIRPLFDQHVEQTTIIDGVHLIRRLQLYVKLGLLKTTTHICTCDITDLYTMLPQEESINILKRFLEHFGYTHVQGMTINAIESLARIVLMENVFYYEQKYYCQIKGGAMGSAFTLTLANIFMWHWEQTLVEHQRNSTELYGRYIDDIFFTSNDSMNHINQLLKEANDRHTNIKLTSVIQNPNSFLDVNINNVGHDLITSVYHKQSSEPYVVPYKSDHPRNVFVNIIECTLLRAIRYSSTLQEFNHERRAIKLMLLYNGYPTKYIYSQFHEFFTKYSFTSMSITPMIHDENEFLLLRRQLLGEATVTQHRRATRLAKTIDYNNIPTDLDPLIKEKLIKRRDKVNSIIVHYKHEKRFSHYKRAFHQLWDDTFYNTPLQTTKIIVGTRNNPNISKELIR
ncbi:unnamed protein product, partial [Adineta steineri]